MDDEEIAATLKDFDEEASKVLQIVLQNEKIEGAKCPEEFESTGLSHEALKKILENLADNGLSNLIINTNYTF